MALAGERFGGLVNMDLIAGLPADRLEGFGRTLERVLAMGPENITVHTLSLKKGSRMTEQGGGLPDPASVEAMLALAAERLRGAGYAPYYLCLEDVILHGLGVDGNSVDVVELQNVQLVRRDGVRAARLHGELGAALHGEKFLHGGQNPVQLLRR